MDNARWLKRWIEDELQPNDQVAVFAYQARLKVYLDFSRDRDEILTAVDAAARGKKDVEPWLTRSEPEFDPNSPSLRGEPAEGQGTVPPGAASYRRRWSCSERRPRGSPAARIW